MRGISFAFHFGETRPTYRISQGGHRQKTLFFSLLAVIILFTGVTFKRIF